MNRRHKFIRIMMVAALFTATARAVTAEETVPSEEAQADEYYIAIVGEMNEAQRVDAGNLDPWHYLQMGYRYDRACVAGCPEHGPKCWQKCAREVRRDKQGTDDEENIIVVSLSCGFLRQEFAVVQLARVGTGRDRLTFRWVSPFVSYVSSGHYCAFKDRVHTRQDGLLLRRWEHGYVELYDFKILTDRRGNFFMSPMGVPDWALEKIRHLFVPLSAEAQDCWTTENFPPSEVELLKKSGLAQLKSAEFYDLCITHGLPVASVLTAYELLYPQSGSGKGEHSGKDGLPTAAPPPVAEPAAVRGEEAEWGPVSQEPGSRFRDCRDCPEMVIVPAGEFMMGSPADEEKRDANEGPQHRVRINRPFALSRFEVTYEEWDTCVDDGGCGGYRPESDRWRGRLPVVYIKWEEARAYTEWLSRKTGQTYRLPSEAEWEYAARAGTDTPFYTGGTISPDLANYDGVSEPYGKGREGRFIGLSIPVGQYPPNRFGLHDMHGNVFEWTADCWNGTYKGAPADGSPWLGGDCSTRVLRSAPASAEAKHHRSAVRVKPWFEDRENMYEIGFRVARDLEVR